MFMDSPSTTVDDNQGSICWAATRLVNEVQSASFDNGLHLISANPYYFLCSVMTIFCNEYLLSLIFLRKQGNIQLSNTKAKLLLGAVFSFLPACSKYTEPNDHRVISSLVPCFKCMDLVSKVLHGHFRPVYLLQASKNDTEKRCFLK